MGPTGLAFDANTDTLYVASTDDNAIYAIPNAAIAQTDQGTGKAVIVDPTHLHGPLALALAPNGDLIVANGDAVDADPNHPNELLEYTPQGKFVGQFQIDNGAPGAAFGLALQTVDGQTRFAAVDDNTNTLDIWTLQSNPPSPGSTPSTPPSPPSPPSSPSVSAIDAFFQSLNAALQSLESSLLASDPMLSGVFAMLNADLTALETMIENQI